MIVWLISAFEPTALDGTRPMRFMGIAEAFLNEGHEVTFFTTTFNHALKKQRFTETKVVRHTENYTTVFIHSSGYSKNISVGRAIAHLDLARKLPAFFHATTVKPDVIFIAFPPVSTVHSVCLWARKHRVKVFVDVIDPWPDVFLKAFSPVTKKAAKMVLYPLYRKMRTIFRIAEGITGISSAYTQWAGTFAKDKPSRHFYPAVNVDDISARLLNIKKIKKTKLTLIYAGSLSSSYDIETILEAATLLELRHPGKTLFLFAGTGPKAHLIVERQTKSSNINYLGWLNEDELYAGYARSDLGLTQHVKGATQSVTYKLFDYLSAGLPVLNSLDSEMNSIIVENQVGFYNKAGDFFELAENIEKFLDKKLLSKFKKNAIGLARKTGNSIEVYRELVHFVTGKAA